MLKALWQTGRIWSCSKVLGIRSFLVNRMRCFRDQAKSQQKCDYIHAFCARSRPSFLKKIHQHCLIYFLDV